MSGDTPYNTNGHAIGQDLQKLRTMQRLWDRIHEQRNVSTANGLVRGGCIPCGPGNDHVVVLAWRAMCRDIGRIAPVYPTFSDSAALPGPKRCESLGHAWGRVT